MLNVLPLFFNSHTCFLNSVWVLSDSFLNDCLWFANLLLNGVSVIATYVSSRPCLVLLLPGRRSLLTNSGFVAGILLSSGNCIFSRLLRSFLSLCFC